MHNLRILVNPLFRTIHKYEHCNEYHLELRNILFSIIYMQIVAIVKLINRALRTENFNTSVLRKIISKGVQNYHKVSIPLLPLFVIPFVLAEVCNSDSTR